MSVSAVFGTLGEKSIGVASSQGSAWKGLIVGLFLSAEGFESTVVGPLLLRAAARALGERILLFAPGTGQQGF